MEEVEAQLNSAPALPAFVESDEEDELIEQPAMPQFLAEDLECHLCGEEFKIGRSLQSVEEHMNKTHIEEVYKFVFQPKTQTNQKQTCKGCPLNHVCPSSNSNTELPKKPNY